LCPACLLRQGAAADSAGGSSAPFVPPSLAEIARVFPQLEILSLIGKGGMGAVYKARQPALDRFVALKIVAPQAEGKGFTERFTREARALARLSHPAIVSVHEFGEAGGLHYLLMEFVDGANLRQLQRAGQLSPREALQIVPQICDALQYAHDEGVVHRDIKPENVLIDRKGRVKIADFGLAKILGVDAETLRLTVEGHVMGTPHYMAPEQVEHPLDVDHRADIYSLGVVFYEMLTGELPLGKFAPPSSRVRGMKLDVRLDEVVLRALEKEPEMRYQQASQVKSSVESLQGENAVTQEERAEQQNHSRHTPAVILALIWAAIFIPFLLDFLHHSHPSPVTGIAMLISAATLVGVGCFFLARRMARVQTKTIILGFVFFLIFLVGLGALAIILPAMQRLSAERERRTATMQVVEVKTAADGIQSEAKLPQGKIELVAVSNHPSTGKSWWRAEGSPFTGGKFENIHSHSSVSGGQIAREFVFQIKDLPADASSPNWKFSPSAGWASGGEPLLQGSPAKGYQVVSATFPQSASAAEVSAGVAMGPWTLVADTEPRGSNEVSTDCLGTTWTVSFLEPVETKDHDTVINVACMPVDFDTQVVVVDLEGKTHEASGKRISSSGPMSQITDTFAGLTPAQIGKVQLQARRFNWVRFPNVALEPAKANQ